MGFFGFTKCRESKGPKPTTLTTPVASIRRRNVRANMQGELVAYYPQSEDRKSTVDDHVTTRTDALASLTQYTYDS